MYVKMKDRGIDPGWRHPRFRDGILEIRAIAIYSLDVDSPPPGGTQFINSKKDLDKVPEVCEIGVMFPDGTYIRLPVPTFKNMFTIVPSGEFTHALFGE